MYLNLTFYKKEKEKKEIEKQNKNIFKSSPQMIASYFLFSIYLLSIIKLRVCIFTYSE